MVNTCSGDGNEKDSNPENSGTPSLPSRLLFNNILPFNFDGDLSANWNLWKQQLNFFVKANGLEEVGNPKKCAILVQSMETSEKLFKIYESFNCNIETIKYDELFKKFEDYFASKTKIT